MTNEVLDLDGFEGHTRGPWVHSKFGSQVLTGDRWSTVCTLRGDAVWEDHSEEPPQQYEWQRQEANARLIAAAPQLLALAKSERAARQSAAARVAELSAENERLRETLLWYADTLCERGTEYEGCGKLDHEECAGCPARVALNKEGKRS